VQAPPPGSHAGYYVAPTGSTTGSGSASQPWDLSTALAGGSGKVQPGDTIWLRGGAYGGPFTSYLTGTAAQPIIVRQYPAERATISGNLVVVGSYTWFWGFEVVSPTPAGATVNGVQSRSIGSKYINLIVHDASGTGITMFDDVADKPDQEAYGCLVYNNGHNNNLDHGFYVNNNSGYRKVRDNIVFNNWAAGIHLYSHLNNGTTDGNVVFNNGAISSVGGADILLNANPLIGGVMRDNYVYRNYSQATSAVSVRGGTDLVFTGNYVYGITDFESLTTLLANNNTLYSSSSPYAYHVSGIVGITGSDAGHTWGSNTWYGNSSAQWGFNGTAYNYANWLTATGLTNPGTYAGSIPPNLVVVRPNAYEAGRANIVVYNWAQLSTVSVDVSGVLNSGDRFVVQNAQNFYGTPALSGTYTGTPLQLPTAGVAAPTPIGRGVNGPTTGPTFNVFVLSKAP
jgi:hypothetical protein